MCQKETLKQQIAAMGIRSDDTLLIHSSCRSVGPVEGGADTILDAFSESLADGLLIFPTHTWNVVKPGVPFDPAETPSCNGVLTELFRHRPGVIRSLHPTHSVAALGRDAAAYTAGEDQAQTPCPRNGCWGKLYDRDAKILFLGCGIRYNTFLHSVEEWADIPDRLAGEPVELHIKMPDGSLKPVSFYGHHSSFGDVSATFGKLELPMLQLKTLTFGYIGDAPSFVMRARDVADLTLDYLKRDPNLFGHWEPVPAGWYRGKETT